MTLTEHANIILSSVLSGDLESMDSSLLELERKATQDGQVHDFPSALLMLAQARTAMCAHRFDIARHLRELENSSLYQRADNTSFSWELAG